MCLFWYDLRQSTHCCWRRKQKSDKLYGRADELHSLENYLSPSPNAAPADYKKCESPSLQFTLKATEQSASDQQGVIRK